MTGSLRDSDKRTEAALVSLMRRGLEEKRGDAESDGGDRWEGRGSKVSSGIGIRNGKLDTLWRSSRVPSPPPCVGSGKLLVCNKARWLHVAWLIMSWVKSPPARYLQGPPFWNSAEYLTDSASWVEA